MPLSKSRQWALEKSRSGKERSMLSPNARKYVDGRGPSGPFSSIEEIKEANKKRGWHFFDADTMRKFGSIVYPEIFWNRYFITSEKDKGVMTSYGWAQAHGGRRLYSVRRAGDDGDITNVGDFCSFTSKRQAERYAEQLRDQPSPCANCLQETYNFNFTCDECKGAKNGA